MASRAVGGMLPAVSVIVASAGCTAASTGALVPATPLVSVPTVSVTVRATDCIGAATGATAPATSWLTLLTVSVTVASAGCTAASTGATAPATSWLGPPGKSGEPTTDGLNGLPGTLD